MNSAGGVVVATMQQWITPISNLKDSTVYFWRVKRDTMDTVNFVWKESSFQYIKGKYGWEQAHFFQYKEDKFTYVKYNRITRSFDFVPTGKTLTCNTYGWVLSPFEWYRLWGTEFKLDLEQQDYAGCGGAAALHVAIIDPISLEPWGTRWKDAQGTTFNPTHNFGNVNDFSTCRNRIDKRFIFQLGSKSQMDGMKNMLNNSVPAGHYVLIYTWNNFAPNSIDTGVLNSMRLLGCKKIDTVSKSRPFIFFAQKGVPASAQEVIGDSLKAAITLSTVLKNNADFGAITSTLIGPAQSWDSLSWRQFSLDNPITRDTARLDVTGIRPGYADSLIKAGLPIDSANIYLKSIDAKIFPQLRLKVNLKDDSLRTSPQMVKWQVFYTPVPEIAIDPKKHFSFVSDTLQEGESFKLKIAYSNVGEMPMDSMQMKYWVVDKHQVIHLLPATTTRPLAVNDTLIAQVSASSAGLDGLNNLWIEANPIGQVKTKPEQYHFNNMAYVPFYVGKDKMNPVLDVTFDGIHILNGDLVSAKPTIMVQVKDENKFLALNDTADFGLYITRPGSSLAEKIYFSSPEIQFTPAVLPANSCKINYAPALLVDGRYQLLVQAKDRSGNLSGSFDYKINFEIVNKSTITQVINYPNPFSTSTKFVFTLTGSEIPTYLKIQILTVSGKVVREITQDELGPIHIGRNITEYAWDGRDQFGDPLGNGLYLYRVVTKIQGNTIEHRETNADQFFDKEWGKMYLMR